MVFGGLFRITCGPFALWSGRIILDGAIGTIFILCSLFPQFRCSRGIAVSIRYCFCCRFQGPLIGLHIKVSAIGTSVFYRRKNEKQERTFCTDPLIFFRTRKAVVCEAALANEGVLRGLVSILPDQGIHKSVHPRGWWSRRINKLWRIVAWIKAIFHRECNDSIVVEAALTVAWNALIVIEIVLIVIKIALTVINIALSAILVFRIETFNQSFGLVKVCGILQLLQLCGTSAFTIVNDDLPFCAVPRDSYPRPPLPFQCEGERTTPGPSSWPIQREDTQGAAGHPRETHLGHPWVPLGRRTGIGGSADRQGLRTVPPVLSSNAQMRTGFPKGIRQSESFHPTRRGSFHTFSSVPSSKDHKYVCIFM